MAKKKKAPPSNPARGFATTSLPSKPKQTVPIAPEPPKQAPPTQSAPEPEWQPPTAEEEAEQELRAIIDKQGARVRREAQRITVKAETEKRTLRTSAQYYPLKLDKVFGIESERFGGNIEDAEVTLGEKVLEIARNEYLAVLEKSPVITDPEETLIATAWTLHKALVGLGLKEKCVEQAIKEVLGRERKGVVDTDTLLEQVLEWIMLFAEPEDLPKFFETNALATKKGTPNTSGTSTPATAPEPATADTRHLALPLRKPPKPPSPSLPPIQADTGSDVPNVALETKDISDQGEDLTCSSEGSDSDFEEETTPETMIPKYIQIQIRLYKIHPTVASSITGGKKAKGGGRKPTKVPPAPPPFHLSDAEKKKVKVLHQRLADFERDPLFDSYVADTAWRDERAKLEEEGWANKERRKRTRKPKASEPSKLTIMEASNAAPSAVDEDDEGLMGGLFDGPPTEEADAAGENVTIRDFEDAPTSTTASKMVKKAGQGKAGVGAAALRKLIQEICKSRDVNAKVKFEDIPGTSISNRCRLIINWTAVPQLEASAPFSSPDDAPNVIIRIPNGTTSVFEMKKLAASTKDQAEGFIITYALFQLYAKKEEKLYLRLPTIWRNLWAELVEEERIKSENEERKVLERLKSLFHRENESANINAPRSDAPSMPPDTSTSASESTLYKPAHERFLESEALMEDWDHRRSSPAFQKMESQRRNLPMWGFRHEILKAIDENPVVVLCGETGCGKSTQLPAFLMEHELSNGRPCKIYCTEPRRISALSLAKRVAEEMGDGKRGAGGLVGYAIRLESMVTDKTRLVYATTGIVMRMLERSSDLEGITHLVLDEVHERSIESDFLLVVLKRLLIKRKDLKVVLMSATVNAEKFSDYLGDAPILRVPGRTFPVQEYFLEDAIETTGFIVEDNPRNRRNDWDDNDAEVEIGSDGVLSAGALQGYRPETRTALNRLDHRRIPYELIVSLLEKISTSPEYIDYSKAILIFLPGLAEIRRLNDMILGHPSFNSRGKNSTGQWLVYMLHSTIASEDQEAAFLVPPPGARKIVLATNIAETGITIPDVTAVIDTGKHKEMRFDERRQLSRLIETFISRANAKQRRGRAGRVQPGICFHLFTREAFESRLAEEQTPEMLRLSLQDLVLRVKICGLGIVEEVLTSALDSPTPKNIRRAVDSLVEVKALTSSEELTPLGRQLSKLPLDVYLGKLALLSTTPLFRCVDAAVTIAALLSSKSPFISPIGYTSEAAAARQSFQRGDSDLLSAYNAYSSWRRVCTSTTTHISEPEWCRRNYISSRTMSSIEDLKLQLFASLADAGFLPLNKEESTSLSRARYSSGPSSYNPSRRTFFQPPQHLDANSTSDAIVAANITAAFYPHLLLRVAPNANTFHPFSNPAITVRSHSTSVNRTPTPGLEWLSYYHMMQTAGRGSDAHETTRAEPVVVALACGDMEWKGWAGVGVLDGKVRFGVRGGREAMVVREVRKWVGGIMAGIGKGRKAEERDAVMQEVWKEALERGWGGERKG